MGLNFRWNFLFKALRAEDDRKMEYLVMCNLINYLILFLDSKYMLNISSLSPYQSLYKIFNTIAIQEIDRPYR